MDQSRLLEERYDFKVRADDEGLHLEATLCRAMYKWAIFDKLIEQNDKTICLVFDFHLYDFLASDFNSEEERVAFLKLALNNMRADAVEASKVMTVIS